MHEYSLTFEEAIRECLFNHYFIRGSNFAEGIYVKNRNGVLVVVDGSKYHKELYKFMISVGGYEQLYKVFTVANPKSIGIEVD